MKVLVTGGCGFIGSNFINYLLNESEETITNLDSQTYAGRGKNLEYMHLDKHPRYELIKGDISNKGLVKKVFSGIKPEIVINFAAESHVDRSISGSNDFIKSNIEGAFNLFEASRTSEIKKFIQVSTDEVYGSIKHGSFNEGANLNPSSLYSASKASAEFLGLSFFKTHNLPITITRSANNYGPYQFPEKLLPLFITNLIGGKGVPLMYSKENPGLNVRDWLNVMDNCRAIWFVALNGKDGEVYNISGNNERTNIELTKFLLNEFEFGEEMIEYVNHRKGHDFRYSISGDKLRNLGFQYKHQDLLSGLQETIKWYKENKDWWAPLKKGL
jgi:dTDP-glucose 4,6-dehydratase